MGKMNTITKDYMSEPKYFADSFNYYLFDGKSIIKPENLQVLDPMELALIPNDAAVETVEKMRDVLKQCVLMADDTATYLILGIENQSDIHYAMPVKNMIYDALNYSNIPIEEGEEEVNMCKGLDELMERNRREGKAEERRSLIITALQGGSTPEEITKVMRIPIAEVHAIANQVD